MGATDNAFIRIFDGGHGLAPNIRRRRRGSGATADRQSITVAAEAALVSEVYAGVAERRPVDVTQQAVPVTSVDMTTLDTMTQEAAANRPSLRLESNAQKTKGPHLRPSVLAQASAAILDPDVLDPVASVSEPVVFRPDPAASVNDANTVPTEAPSPPATQPQEEPEESTTTAIATNGIPSPDRQVATWIPQWEVDRFRWPEICDRLNQESASSLSEVVRPILSSAWRGKNVLAVTSFGRNEGGSTIALSVAKMAASFNVPVALVDGDLENPALGTSLGMAYEYGWNDMVLPMSLKEVAIGSLQDRVVVLPLNEHAGDVDPCMAVHMLKELSDNFELVVVDAGPIFTAAYRWFAEPISHDIHGTLIVRDIRETNSHQMEDVCSRLESVGISEIAIVENFRDEPR